MHKDLAILVVFVWIGCHLNARDPDFKPNTHIGIHGGMNFSTVGFKPQIKESYLPSPAFGLVFRHVSEPNIGLQIEVNSWGKGWKELIDSVGSYTRNLHTINIPVMASFIAGSKTIRFAFTIGPYISYLYKDSETIEMPEEYFRLHYQKPLASNWEFGFTGGVSAEIHTKLGAFAIRASYNQALTNLYPLNKEYYFSASRQQVIHAGIMYFYSF